MFRITRYGGAAAAACLLIGATVWLVLLDRTAGIAFAEVQEQVQKAESIQYVHTQEIEIQPPPKGQVLLVDQAPRNQRVFILGRYLERTENLDADGRVTSVYIADARNGRFVTIELQSKRFIDHTIQMTLRGDGGGWKERPLTPMPEVDFYKRIRDVPADPVKQLPEKKLGNRTVVGFDYEEKHDNGTWKRTYWVDPETKLPVRVEITYTSVGVDPAGAEMRSVTRSVLSDFVFDAKLDESLFDTAPPEGYEVVKGGFGSIE